MSDKQHQHIEAPGPSEMNDPAVRLEMRKAAIWIGMAVAVLLVGLLAQPILLIIGGLVFAAMLDGGTRLLGRILPIARGLRLAIVVVAALGFLGWVLWTTGSQLVAQAATLQVTVAAQIDRIGEWAASVGLTATPNDLKDLGGQAINSIGRVTAAVTSVLGTVTTMGMMIVLGVFIAVEPRLYERGFAWMLPLDHRAHFYETMDKMGYTLRRLMAGRLLGMGVEGVGTWLLLSWAGVPMAAILGVLTGLLAFLPNIGSLISGVLIVLVGFSAGFDTGIYAFFIYLAVQMVDGYFIVPTVARRTVDLAPALVLGAQLLLGTLFGILGLALADPIVAMIKVFLEKQSDRAARIEEEKSTRARAKASRAISQRKRAG